MTEHAVGVTRRAGPATPGERPAPPRNPMEATMDRLLIPALALAVLVTPSTAALPDC